MFRKLKLIDLIYTILEFSTALCMNVFEFYITFLHKHVTKGLKTCLTPGYLKY